MKLYCPECGRPLTYQADFPDTRTSVDMFIASCKKDGLFEVSVELQDGSHSIQPYEGNVEDLEPREEEEQ